ncbi:MAG: hypothetical protein V4713_07735 [Pseudomonadota bacterium]
MIDIDSATQTRISLQRGQAHYEQLQQGTLIRAATGTVLVTSHVWVENTLITVKTPVYPGGVFDLPASGWYEIAAQSEAEVLLILPFKRLQKVWRRINLLISPSARL